MNEPVPRASGCRLVQWFSSYSTRKTDRNAAFLRPLGSRTSEAMVRQSSFGLASVAVARPAPTAVTGPTHRITAEEGDVGLLRPLFTPVSWLRSGDQVNPRASVRRSPWSGTGMLTGRVGPFC